MDKKNERIKEVRKHVGMTQREFAKILGVSNTYISKVEKGVTPVTDRLIMQISNVFGIELEWLYEGTGEMIVIIETEEDFKHKPTIWILPSIYDLIDSNLEDIIDVESFSYLETGSSKASEYLLIIANIISTLNLRNAPLKANLFYKKLTQQQIKQYIDKLKNDLEGEINKLAEFYLKNSVENKE